MVDLATVLPWEPRRELIIPKLQEIIHFENPQGVHSIDAIVKITRRDQEGKQLPIDAQGNYIPRKHIVLAYEYYKTQIIINESHEEGYCLPHHFLEVALSAEYPKGADGYYIKDGKLHQDPIDYNLRAYDPELVDFLLQSQLVAQWELLESSLDMMVNVWLTRENLNKTSKVNMPNLYTVVKQKEAKIGYNEAEPNGTKYAYPGMKLKDYTGTYGFGPKSPLIAQLRMKKAA